jgi:hypothetical protein
LDGFAEGHHDIGADEDDKYTFATELINIRAAMSIGSPREAETLQVKGMSLRRRLALYIAPARLYAGDRGIVESDHMLIQTVGRKSDHGPVKFKGRRVSGITSDLP